MCTQLDLFSFICRPKLAGTRRFVTKQRNDIHIKGRHNCSPFSLIRFLDNALYVGEYCYIVIGEAPKRVLCAVLYLEGVEA